MNDRYLISMEDCSMEDMMKLCGVNDVHIKVIRDEFSCEIVMRQNQFIIIDSEISQCKKIEAVMHTIQDMLEHHIDVLERDVLYLCRLAKMDRIHEFQVKEQTPIGKTVNGKLIYPKTIGQRYLYQCMKHNDIVFASGVAGTGKTYLAVVYAVSLLKKGDISKLILTRPAVEAGENLGFLPGDLKEKVDPYLRPLYDALNDTLGSEQVEKLMEKEIIEIAPLAYMRGRTLDNAFIILDEAQNTTRSQMKMFLTRMGFHSRVVITGDISQIDLIRKSDSGLLHAKRLLQGMEGIAFAELTSLDVVRNPLVQKIIERYDEEEHNHGKTAVD